MLRNSDTNTIFGLNVATLIISALELLLCVLLAVVLVWLGSSGGETMVDLIDDATTTLSDGVSASPSSDAAVTSVASGLGWDPSDMAKNIAGSTDMNVPEYNSASTEAFLDLLAGTVFLGVIALVFYAIPCAVSLIGGIIGVRGARNPMKSKAIFGWSLAGAICAFITCRWIVMVLQIISAVYAHRVSTQYLPVQQQQQMGVGVGQPMPAGYQQQPQAQPMVSQQPAPTAPQNAAAQPVQHPTTNGTAAGVNPRFNGNGGNTQQ